MVRLSDVAARAGVSVGSASRAVNGHPRVGREIRARVEAAARELGYRPHPLAQGLRSRRARALSLVVPDITNPFFAELARELETDLARRGYQLALRDSRESPETEREAIRSALEHSPSGLVVVPTATTGGLPDTGRVPLVVCDRRLPGHRAPAVVSDNRQGASAATAYLMGLGHRRIACVAGPEGVHAADERLAGYLALVPPSDRLVVRGAFDYDTGLRAVDALLTADRPPTAVLAGSDQQAIGVMHALLRRGLRVPHDVSVCGFDAIALSALTSPGLTTIRQPVRAIAETAVALLLDRDRDADPGAAPAGRPGRRPARSDDHPGDRPDADPRGDHDPDADPDTGPGSDPDVDRDREPVTVSLPTELVVRDSCAPPPAASRPAPNHP
jgi:LacI family transcriptional regulator